MSHQILGENPVGKMVSIKTDVNGFLALSSTSAGSTLSTAAKGSTPAGSVTSRNISSSVQALDVVLRGGADGELANVSFTGSDARGDQNALTVMSWTELFNGNTYERARSIIAALATGMGATAVAQAPNSAIGAAVDLAVQDGATVTLVAKATAGNVYEIQGHSDTAGFIQVHNKATAPAATNVPILSFAVAANTNYVKTLQLPVNCTAGIAVGFSSTRGTFTAGAGSIRFEVMYK